MIFDEEDYLAHYGILRKSGRYPWGSGGTVPERSANFLSTVAEMKRQGMSDPDIARAFHTKEDPFTTSDLRSLRTIALNEKKQHDISTAQRLQATGMSNVAIGKEMGIPESSVRGLLAPGAADRAQILKSTTDMLRRQVAEKKYIDVGTAVSNQLKVSDVHMKTAIAALREEGYQIHYYKVPTGPNQFTKYKVLIGPDSTYKEMSAALRAGGLRQIQEHSDDGGRSFTGQIQSPISLSSKRLQVKYGDEGGSNADGVIYVRPGVSDVSIGKKRYAQVRIAVDGTHYIKGMAVYKDDLPDGVDIQFNTNKSSTGNKLDALKPLKKNDAGEIDKDSFGAQISRQIPHFDKHGNAIDGTVSSVMNIVNDEGTWDKWSRTLSSQFLSKQSVGLAQEQLGMMYERKKRELDVITSLTNPAVRRKLLESYADDMDSSAVKMKANALPRQRTQVLMPVQSMKETEAYAPNFNTGDRVVLVRHPHGGTFELPELTVNNRNREARALFGPDAEDVVGIHPKVAKRLSGADFDGDTVLVIPNNSGRIKTDRPLEGLRDFDPQRDYKSYDGMRTIDGGVYRASTNSVDYGGRQPKGKNMQTEMGKISNLITDMTIRRASHAELAAAVRHSMVIIDAEKHHLDYKKSYADNGIAALAKKYQPRDEKVSTSRDGGASTLISRAKQTERVPVRRGRPAAEGGPIDRTTGERKFVPKGELIRDRKTGQLVLKTEEVPKLLERKSAHELSSGTNIESVYADHSDRIRGLANQARKEFVNTPSTPYSPSAKLVYSKQVKSLDAKLDIAVQNSPRERQARIVARARVNAIKDANPNLTSAELKKIEARALNDARIRTGAIKQRVVIEHDEWAAIQAGAISTSKLEKILANTNLEDVKKLATPRAATVMTSIMVARAKTMLAQGYSQADVAAQLGVPVSTLTSSSALE